MCSAAGNNFFKFFVLCVLHFKFLFFCCLFFVRLDVFFLFHDSLLLDVRVIVKERERVLSVRYYNSKGERQRGEKENEP